MRITELGTWHPSVITVAGVPRFAARPTGGRASRVRLRVARREPESVSVRPASHCEAEDVGRLEAQTEVGHHDVVFDAARGVETSGEPTELGDGIGADGIGVRSAVP